MALAGLDDVQAQVRRNQARYALYRTLLAPLPGLRLVPFDDRHACSFKTIVVELLPAWPLGRAATLARLNAAGMLARAYYDPPLHRKPMAYPRIPAHMPATDALAARFMLLPCGHHVADGDIRAVVRVLAELAA